MGGLRKYMPITHVTFLIGCLAIAGIFPFAGFFSKDEMLAAMFQRHWFSGRMDGNGGRSDLVLYVPSLFHGVRWEENPKYKEHKPHDAPWQMSVPLIFLAIVSTVCGFVPFGEFVTWDGVPYHIHFEIPVVVTSLTVAVLAILLAMVMYRKKNGIPARLKNAMPGLGRLPIIVSIGTRCICSSRIRLSSESYARASHGLTVTSLTRLWTCLPKSLRRLRMLSRACSQARFRHTFTGILQVRFSLGYHMAVPDLIHIATQKKFRLCLEIY